MWHFVLPLKEQAQLSTLLTQPHRFYHNITHINDLLGELAGWHRQAAYADKIKKLVTYGIWYHDAIYDPYAEYGFNEEHSALLFEEYHRDSAVLDTFELNRVSDMIRATAKHTSQQNYHEGKVPFIELHVSVMLDCDLAGFGKPWDEYKINGENIRKEYFKTSDKDFYTGRLQFLNKMKQRIELFGSIYYNTYFHDRYNEQAWKNITTDIEMIESRA